LIELERRAFDLGMADESEESPAPESVIDSIAARVAQLAGSDISADEP
jgi:hypothetical protein